MILNALDGKPLPVYGDGKQIRDWLYVEDHARALYLVVTQGKIGETYNIGGFNEQQNIQVVRTICELLEELAPNKPQGIAHYADLITHVTDRAGHDVRYAIDASKIQRELGWAPQDRAMVFGQPSMVAARARWQLQARTPWQSRITPLSAVYPFSGCLCC